MILYPWGSLVSVYFLRTMWLSLEIMCHLSNVSCYLSVFQIKSPCLGHHLPFTGCLVDWWAIAGKCVHRINISHWDCVDVLIFYFCRDALIIHINGINYGISTNLYGMYWSNSTIRFLFWFLCLQFHLVDCVWGVLPACMSSHLCLVPKEAQEVIWSFITGVTGHFELPVAAGSWTLVLWKNSKCFELQSHLSSPMAPALCNTRDWT